MDKIEVTTRDLTQANIYAIAEMFPGVVTEVTGAEGQVVEAVDFDRLGRASEPVRLPQIFLQTRRCVLISMNQSILNRREISSSRATTSKLSRSSKSHISAK